MVRPLALYSLRPTLQRHGLADLLGLDDGLIAKIAELVRLGVAVERAVAEQLPAAPVHDDAKRGIAASVVALQDPRRAGLPVLAHGEPPLVGEPLLVRIAVGRRIGFFVAVAEHEHLALG